MRHEDHSPRFLWLSQSAGSWAEDAVPLKSNGFLSCGCEGYPPIPEKTGLKRKSSHPPLPRRRCRRCRRQVRRRRRHRSRSLSSSSKIQILGLFVTVVIGGGVLGRVGTGLFPSSSAVLRNVGQRSLIGRRVPGLSPGGVAIKADSTGGIHNIARSIFSLVIFQLPP